jgi:hypothetical protein
MAFTFSVVPDTHSKFAPHVNVESVSHSVSSLSTDECFPVGQATQASALENGFNMGSSMNVPGEQQPYRAVLDPVLLNALEAPLKDSHAPPHKVLLNPLSLNMLPMYVTADVSHFERSELKLDAPKNMPSIFVTALVSHLDRSALKLPNVLLARPTP